MANRNLIAWVSGSRIGGYHLFIVTNAETRAFRALNASPFENFRAAQDIANAIKAHVMKKRAAERAKKNKRTPR